MSDNKANSTFIRREIIEQYKTPLHIVDKNKIQNNCRSFMRVFRNYYAGTDFFYSYKTNSVPAILAVIHNEGFGAEVVSGFELDLALKLGVNPERIIFNGPAKTAQEIEKAVSLGIKLINIDSPDELALVKNLAETTKKKVPIGIRIKSFYDKTAHFGFSPDLGELMPALKVINANKYLELKAVHLHQGADIRKVTPYLTAVKNIARLLQAIKKNTGMEIENLDLGGGFGISSVRHLNYVERISMKIFPYEPLVSDAVRIEHFASKISSCLNVQFGKLGLQFPRLFLEPGRAITADAQDLFLSVACIKGRTVIINGGAFSIAFPLMWELHDITVLGKESLPKTKFYKICGNLCASSDVFFDHVKLPPLERGDVIIIKGVGAYFNSFSSNFSFPRPGILMLEDGIRATLIRRRERFEDMIAADIIPPRIR